jgi:topoisomerase IA-like protein
VTLDEALAVYAEPKRGRGGRAAPAPLKELGVDPVSEKPITVRSGRYGDYVSDGETNATLRGADSPESLTFERAVELLADRRAAGPSKKKSAAEDDGEEDDGEEVDGEEDGGHEDDGEEDGGRRRRSPRRRRPRRGPRRRDATPPPRC